MAARVIARIAMRAAVLTGAHEALRSSFGADGRIQYRPRARSKFNDDSA
jgi:hypothetical protein